MKIPITTQRSLCSTELSNVISRICVIAHSLSALQFRLSDKLLGDSEEDHGGDDDGDNVGRSLRRREKAVSKASPRWAG